MRNYYKNEIIKRSKTLSDYHQSICGIYFLLKEGVVVFVGRSIDYHMSVKHHILDEDVDFDSVFFHPCAEDQLDAKLKEYLDALLPSEDKQTPDEPIRQKKKVSDTSCVQDTNRINFVEVSKWNGSHLEKMSFRKKGDHMYVRLKDMVYTFLRMDEIVVDGKTYRCDGILGRVVAVN